MSAIAEAAACIRCMARLSLHSHHPSVDSEFREAGIHVIDSTCSAPVFARGQVSAAYEGFVHLFDAAVSPLGERHHGTDAMSSSSLASNSVSKKATRQHMCSAGSWTRAKTQTVMLAFWQSRPRM